MAEPFLAEIRLFSFNTVPSGWAQCNGQLLQVAQNQALFTLIGSTFGGDGKTTFALPNLQGAVPLMPNATVPYGSTGGEESHTLTISEIPAHTHQATAGSDASTNVTTSNVWGTASTISSYGETNNSTMSSNALSTAGGSQGHSNMQPYIVVNYCIALQGIWPPKN
jgi:microcystin-dependent protein